jgi:hypothetical protein
MSKELVRICGITSFSENIVHFSQRGKRDRERVTERWKDQFQECLLDSKQISESNAS